MATQNQTVKVWLAENHPQILAEYNEFRKFWRNEKARDWFKKNKATGRPAGRPKKPKNN